MTTVSELGITMSALIGFSINTVTVVCTELCTADCAKEAASTGGGHYAGNRSVAVEPNTKADFEVVYTAPNELRKSITAGSDSIY